MNRKRVFFNDTSAMAFEMLHVERHPSAADQSEYHLFSVIEW
ncbi:hypothetical protein OAH34_03015 [bacterium]|nr:hypothetical protein [bacterium]